ncbi:hypothetical protein D3C71_190880 [compost metagenome]
MVGQAALARYGDLRVAIFRVDKDQVDIGRNIEFAAALLAHRQHHQGLFLARFLADRHAVQGHHLGHDGVHVRADGEIGKACHGSDDFVQVGPAFQIACDQAADEQVAQAAHGPLGRQRRRGGVRLGGQLGGKIEPVQRRAHQLRYLRGALGGGVQPALVETGGGNQRLCAHGIGKCLVDAACMFLFNLAANGGGCGKIMPLASRPTLRALPDDGKGGFAQTQAQGRRRAPRMQTIFAII